MNYSCPICSGGMAEMPGEKMHPNSKEHGMTLYCPSKTCTAQEVSAHGKHVKEAWENIVLKYVSRKET